MKTYIRILRYARKYKYKFLIGIILSFFVSVFNGASLTALRPIFDVLGSGTNKPFQLEFDREEVNRLLANGYREQLSKLFSHPSYEMQRKWLRPGTNETEGSQNTEKLPQETLEQHLPKAASGFLEQIKLKTTVWKLEANAIFIQYGAFQLLVYICIGVLPIYLLKLFSTLGTVYFIGSTGLRSVRDLRNDLYLKLQRLPLNYFVREKTGILMSRIINDVTIVSDAVSHDLRISINNFFIIVTHLTILLFLSYKLVLICMVGVPLLLWPVNHFAKRIKGITTNEQVRLADLNGHLQELITGIRVIRAFGMETYEHVRFQGINNGLCEQTLKYRVNHTIGPAIVEFATSLIVIGLLMYGGMIITEGEMTYGAFFTFLFVLLVILSPVKQMASWFNLLHRTVAAGERIFEIMDKPGEVIDPPNPIHLPRIAKSIEFQSVYFTYPETDSPVLKNINVYAPVGSVVALVGHSGAGKSTLVDLIPRFYDPNQGSINFDGIDIRKLSLKDLRARIGVVTQEIFLFNGTIRENIAYGREDISFEKIRQAAKLAYADEFIEQLPDKYDTFIGERGLLLSGGQRQRISIARALLKDPELLILDEATSALDTHSERLVQKALEELMKNRTTFVIAHRLSTIYRADKILVLENGEIVEEGTHDELLKIKGRYEELYKMQFQS